MQTMSISALELLERLDALEDEMHRGRVEQMRWVLGCFANVIPICLRAMYVLLKVVRP